MVPPLVGLAAFLASIMYTGGFVNETVDAQFALRAGSALLLGIGAAWLARVLMK